MSVSKKIRYWYYGDNNKQEYKDIGYKDTSHLVNYLSDVPDITQLVGSCLSDKWYSFDGERLFYCSSIEFLELILSIHSTVRFIQKTVPLGRNNYILGDLACYTEEQIQQKDLAGAMLIMPNEMNRFLELRFDYHKGIFPMAKVVFQFVIRFDDLLEGNILACIAYDESSDNVILGLDNDMYIIGNYNKIIQQLNETATEKQTEVTIFNIIKGVFRMSVNDVSIVSVGSEPSNNDDNVRSAHPELFENEDYASRSIKNIPACIEAIVECETFVECEAFH